MSDVAIRVDHLGKRYRLGEIGGFGSLGSRLGRLLGGRRDGDAGHPARPTDDEIWALRDVCLEVKRGEVVGIVGANGAGKSTLLKVLSRITEPTEGQALVYGRVGSLLEVGTGFHPELTGRDNIYLNAAILGMRKAEIDRKLDEIVAFAEIEKFLDTPVKRYSSGMYVRLAFAVAAQLEPEILLVDEVLSVGDASFQKRCLGKMGEVSRAGRTVLFVSHNMGAVKALTTSAVWLEKGRVRDRGDAVEVVNRYLSASWVELEGDGVFEASFLDSRRIVSREYGGRLRLKSVVLKDAAGAVSGVHREGSTVSLELEFAALVEVNALEACVRVRNTDGQIVFTVLPGKREEKLGEGAYRAVVEFELGALLPGVYTGDVMLLSHMPQDAVSPAFQFEIVPEPRHEGDHRTTIFGTAAASGYGHLGVMRVRSAWSDFARTGSKA
jgi:lipopolysaccharide transport system ATP-binding protein